MPEQSPGGPAAQVPAATAADVYYVTDGYIH